MPPTATQLLTWHEFAALRDPPNRHELIRGEVVTMPPPHTYHGFYSNNVQTPLSVHVRGRKLGVVLGSETGFLIEQNPDTVRAPDVAFISAARWPAEPFSGYFRGAPDFAVEVLSENDKVFDVDEKIDAWLKAGCKLVWLVNPRSAPSPPSVRASPKPPSTRTPPPTPATWSQASRWRSVRSLSNPLDYPMSLPPTYRLLESHEWHKLDGDTVTIGITQIAADELTDVTYVSLPKIGQTLKAHDRFGEIESVKATSDLYVGMGGTVTEINDAVNHDPSLVNQDPYEKGWMIKLKVTDPSEFQKLLSAADYLAKSGH
ncbi:MAG: glycine cleavage system protein GcvH [Tepidisphaeraceae bacterium]